MTPPVPTSVDPGTLAARLRALFLAPPPRLTLAVAESLTCGHLQAAIGAVSGASDFFLGGITAYSLAIKVRHLGVDETAARRCNAVSLAVAAQMAVGVCRLFGSDLAVSTTGYAEPDPAGGFPDPGAFFAIAHRAREGEAIEIVRDGFFQGPGLTRTEMQAAVAREALSSLEAVLRSLRASAASRP